MNNIKESKRVYTISKDYPITTIRDMFEEGDIVPQPDYQRDYVMDDKKASKLIESILMGIPIPTVYLCEENDSTYSIIDGQQRLTSIVRYLKNEFELKGLEELVELNNKRFCDLEKTIQRELKSSAIHSIVLTKESQELKYEIFARLNQGSISLKPQELRNCVYRGTFNNMLENIAKTNKNLPSLFLGDNKRKQYQENILRYFALRNFQEYSSSIGKTMNNYMKTHQNEDIKILEEEKKKFNGTIDIIKQVLGDYAFCSYDREKKQMMNKFSGSVYDSIIIAFSMFNNHDLMLHADEIRKEIDDIKINDMAYQDYTYAATGSKNRVIGRIMKIYNLLVTIIGKNGDIGVKRIFSKDIKEELYYKGYICKFCGNEILSIEDAEIDHIKAFNNGGETVIDNAQLLHRHCNRVKQDNEIEFETEENE